jgi:hypothetical protein
MYDFPEAPLTLRSCQFDTCKLINFAKLSRYEDLHPSTSSSTTCGRTHFEACFGVWLFSSVQISPLQRAFIARCRVSFFQPNT